MTGGIVSSIRAHKFLYGNAALLAALMLSSWVFVLVETVGTASPLSTEAWSRAWQFVQSLAGSGETTAAYLEWEEWRSALRLATQTLAMSVLATAMAATGALMTVAFAASSLAYGNQSPFGPVAGRALFALVRAMYILTRAVPELVWAMIIVFVISPGILAGAVALGVHNLGVLGRLGAEVVEDVDQAPIRSLRTSGAGNLQTLLYGVLPQVLPQFVTYLLYRWEVVIRTTAVIGFIAAAGLGYQLRLDLSFFRYTDVALLLMVYVLLVWGVDLVSIALRRLAR